MAIVGKINQIDVNDSQFAIDLSYLNLNDFLNNPNAYSSKATARSAVPTYFRTNGRAITYKLILGNDYIWVSEQFIGSSWSTADADWLDLGPVKVSQNTSTGEYNLEIGNTEIQSSKDLGQPIEFVLANSGFGLQVGGGRLNLEGDLNLYLNNQSLAGIKRIRIIGSFLFTNNNYALYGFYTGVPDVTPLGTPDTTNYISGGSNEAQNKLCYVDRIIDVPDNAPYLWISYPVNCALKVYPVDVPVIDTEPIIDSQNLVKSGGVFKNQSDINDWYVGDRRIIPTLSARRKSVINAIKSIWFEGASGIFNNDSYYAKIGAFGVNSTDLQNLNSVILTLYLTNGQGTTTPNLYNYVGWKIPIVKVGNIAHIVIDGDIPEMGKCHVILNVGELDFTDTEIVSQYNMLVNDGVGRENYALLLRKRIASYLAEDAIQDSILVRDRKLFKPWLEKIGDLAYVMPSGSLPSLFDSIVDVWATDIDSTWFFDSAYKVKFGFFGINARTLADATRMWVFMFLTNGTNYAIADCGGFDLTDATKYGTIHLIGNSNSSTQKFKIHILLDVSKLDFSHISQSAVSNYYYFCNDGARTDWGLFVNKKTSTIYNSVIIDALPQENSNNAASSGGVYEQLAELRSGLSLQKLQYYDKILCAGDSVTQGYCVEGTQEHPQTLYQVVAAKSYPTALGKLLPKAEINNQAQSGITPKGWYETFYPNIDFSQYELMVFELGLNGQLNINDIDVPGTNTNYYKLIIQGARQQNPTAVIALTRSSHYANNWIPILETFANDYNCLVLDLQSAESKAIIDLDAQILHGYYDNEGTPAIDWAHFTRKGYNCKAYVIARMLEKRLSNATVYNV